MTQSQIKKELEQIEDIKLLKEEVVKYLDMDISEKVLSKYINKIKKYELNVERIKKMKETELDFLKTYDYVFGIDEVGRGPLAGPVVACCTMMSKESMLLAVDDSKKIKEDVREELYDKILDEAKICFCGMRDSKKIDELNILNATFEAMKEAYDKATENIDKDKKILVLIDGNLKNPLIDARQIPIVKGDAKIYSIAASSIVAKVTRDRIMNELDSTYPEYDFINNKGYGTEKHRQALKAKGPIEGLHRKTFIKNLI